MYRTIILIGALLLTPARASLIPDSFPWKPLNIDYNGETAIYDYEPQEMDYATTLYLGDGYSSMDRTIHDIQQSQTLMINNYVGDSRRHGTFNGAMFFGNKFAHIIGLDIEAQDINFYAGVIGVKEELK